MKGVFGIGSSADLLKKLESEFADFLKEPHNAYVAYNFFVTAWHLLEWKYPDPGGKAIRNSIRDGTPLLQICEHLAVGAKHFEPSSPKHKSVSHSKLGGVWAEGVWAKGFWNDKFWATWLTITLEGDAKAQYGGHVKAHELASLIMDYWRANI